MKTKSKFLIFVASLLFVLGNLRADDDGTIVVMEKSYYDQCRLDFLTSLINLDSQVDLAYNLLTADFERMRDYLLNVMTQVTLANENANYLLQSTTLNNSYDRQRVQIIYDSTSIARDNVQNSLGSLSSITNNLRSSYEDIKLDITAVSNSFPTVITSTNFVLYVIVTNTFEFASNQLDNAQNTYTNFLNYYKGIEDDLLNQYRATVTNLLDWSMLRDVINASWWTYSNPGLYTDRYQYFNYDWTSAMAASQGTVSIFPILANQRYYWNGRGWQLPDSASDIEFLLFSVQGIHDAVQQDALAHTLEHELLWQACTNQYISFPNSSGAVTNRLVQLYSAPESYDGQVNKVVQSRNWFQRLELWLSSIARNTFHAPDTEFNDSLKDQRENELETMTNDVQNALSTPLDSFVSLGGESTNSLNLAFNHFNDNLIKCLNHFSLEPNRPTRGGRSEGQTAQQRFAKVGFLDVHFVGEKLNDLTGRYPDMPDKIVLQDYTHGNEANSAWSIMLNLIEIVHKVFSVLWLLIGFGLAVWECVMLAKFFLFIWFRLIKFIPHVSRYALGS